MASSTAWSSCCDVLSCCFRFIASSRIYANLGQSTLSGVKEQGEGRVSGMESKVSKTGEWSHNKSVLS